jgi:hypothetical protein
MAFVLGFRQSPLSNMSFPSRPRWELALASAPLWPIGWLIVFASAARVKLGYWPSYAHPDPTTLHWLPADIMVLPLLLLAPLAGVRVSHRCNISNGRWSLRLVRVPDDTGVLWRVALVADT